MNVCTRCGLRFRGEGLCGICRIELRDPDGRRDHMLEFGTLYAKTHGMNPPRG